VDGLEATLTRIFESAGKSSPAEPRWLMSLRSDAFARYRVLGMPSTRHEDWKYCSLTPLGRFELGTGLPAQPAPEPELLEADSVARLVFVDGKLDRTRSSLDGLPQGLRIASVAELVTSGESALPQALEAYVRNHDDGVKAVNTALFTDGAWIEVAAGTAVAKPVHLIFIATEGHAPCVRNVIRVGGRAELRVIEEFVSKGSRPALTNSVTQIEVAPGGILKQLKLQHESGASGHLADTRVEQAKDSTFESLWISLGASVSRNEIHARLGDTNSECSLFGLYGARAREQVDSHTVIDHASPGCRSRETYKGILADEAKGSFTGRILVRKDAQKTDSRQMNRSLLLSDRAIANTRPQLQIHADDVKCSHGATVGRLDAEQLFYLRSRGIGLEAARRLVSRAFAGELIEFGGWNTNLGVFLDRWLDSDARVNQKVATTFSGAQG
jgi:Fe-S cluster assembly protein SufD